MTGPRRIGAATLYRGDALEILPGLEGIDHIVTDPPYEAVLHRAAAAGRVRRTDGRAVPRGADFEGIDEIREAVGRALVAASRGWVLAFTLAEGVGAWRDALQAAGGRYDTCLAWIKPDAAPRFNGQGPARGFECLVSAWCGRGHRSWNGGGRRGVFTYPTAKGGHPTAKPVPLMAALIQLYTRPGDLVCDPFMGGGSTGLAALALGRRFLGIERDEAHFALACERLDAAARQPALPFAAPPAAVQTALALEPAP